jgi:hypothetical protein
MTKKSSIFKKILENQMESDIPEPQALEKTMIGDFPSSIVDIPKPDINKIPIEDLTQDQKEILRLRNLMGDIRERSKLSKAGLTSYAKNIPENLKIAKELAKKIKGVSVLGKVAGPIGAGISIAEDVLGAEEVGSGEEELVKKQLKEAEMMKNKSEEERQAIENIKKQSEELAKKQVSPIDMIKEVGGAADINPKQARLMQGERESPDIEDESSLNMENYEKLLKRKLGYK